MSELRYLILGVTASGKSRLAFDLAQTLGGEIISIDSMKVYKKMDIGTAKPPLERRNAVKYHLVDVVEPWEAFSVSDFLELSEQAATQILTKEKPVIGAGGTAMYIKNMLYGLFDGPGSDLDLRKKLKERLEIEGHGKLHQELTEVDPVAAQKIHPNDARRVVRALEVFKLTGKPISSFQTQFSAPAPDPRWRVIGLRRDKDVESRRINARVKKMVEMGLVDEVRELFNMDKPLSKQAQVAIGYAEFKDYFDGNITLDKAIEKVKINTRRLAKSQRTWFKSFRGVEWLDFGEDASSQEILDRTMSLINSGK